MEKLFWSEQFSLDSPEIDLAHREFIEKLNQIADTPDNQLADSLYALIKEMETDFQQEEAFMEAAQYPEIKTHREQHARVLSSFHQVVPEVMRGDFASAHQVLDLLPSWLVLHITTMDRALALYLKVRT